MVVEGRTKYVKVISRKRTILYRSVIKRTNVHNPIMESMTFLWTLLVNHKYHRYLYFHKFKILNKNDFVNKRKSPDNVKFFN